jgi:hypothetical protein
MRFLSDVVLFWRVSQDQTTRALKMTAKLETRSEPDGTLNVALMGRWQTGRKNPSGMDAQQLLSASGVKRVQFDSRQLDEWDSSLVVFLSALAARGAASGVDVDPAGLPAGARRLLDLSRAVPPKADATASHNQSSLLARIGELGLRTTQSVKDTLDFTGELALSVMRLIQGKARFRMVDVLEAIQQCGWQALPIVSLISLLVGLILAFMGAVQLSMFGAQIYVADLVGIGMTREMGAVMTGVIMAGRTGAAFAANLGTMQVNEEIDALQTLGVSPHGLSGDPANGGPGADDAPVVHLCRLHGHIGRHDRGRRRIRYFGDSIPDPNSRFIDNNPHRLRRLQKCHFRADCGHVRLHAGDALRAKRCCRWRSHHLCGGDAIVYIVVADGFLPY